MFIESDYRLNVTMMFNINSDSQKTTFSFEVELQNEKAYFGRVEAVDVIGQFSERLIKTLKARMAACTALLMSHMNDVVRNDGYHISFKAKNGLIKYFSIPAYQAMQKAVENLRKGNYCYVVEDALQCNQILKAIANDKDFGYEDAGVFPRSLLIDILMECSLAPCDPSKYVSRSKVSES